MPKKIAIVGAGWMAAYHVAGFRGAGAEVVAIVDKVPAAAKAASQKYGVDKTFSEPKELFAAIKDLDAVSIITPNVFHHPLVMEALAAGKHVFCEKPPALNAADVSQMVDAAKKANRTLMFNFNNRARPESYAMREYFKSGAVGRVNSAQAAWIRRNGIPGFGGWFTNKKLSGGGPLIDLLHMVDLALHFMATPSPPTCSATPSTTTWTRSSRAPGASRTWRAASPTSRRRPTRSSPSRAARCSPSGIPGPS